MCPACIAAATLIVAGAASGGGLTAFALNKLRAETAKSMDQPTRPEEGAPASGARS